MTYIQLLLLASSLLFLAVPIFSLYVKQHCENNIGNEFVFSVPEMFRTGTPPELLFSSTTTYDVTVHIETPIWSHADSLMDQITLQPGSVYTYKLSESVRVLGSRLSTCGVRVWSTDPIIVYLTNRQDYTMDAMLVFPSIHAGLEYMVAIFNQTSTNAAYYTTVTITSTSVNNNVFLRLPDGVSLTYDTGSSSVVASGEFSVTLEKYETFQITAHDLSGTRVVSDFPVSVVVGHTFLRIGGTETTTTKDYVMAMLPPVSAMATEYHVVGYPTHTQPTIARIVTSQPSTTINITQTTTRTIFAPNLGFIHDVTIQPLDGATITSSKPVAVAVLSSSKNRGDSGDTSLVFALSHDDYLSEYLFLTPVNTISTGEFSNEVILLSHDSTQQVLLDGGLVTGSWQKFNNIDLWYIIAPVAFGAHSLKSSKFFGAYLIGYGRNEQYTVSAGRYFATSTNIAGIPKTRTKQCTGEYNDVILNVSPLLDVTANSIGHCQAMCLSNGDCQFFASSRDPVLIDQSCRCQIFIEHDGCAQMVPELNTNIYVCAEGMDS